MSGIKVSLCSKKSFAPINTGVDELRKYYEEEEVDQLIPKTKTKGSKSVYFADSKNAEEVEDMKDEARRLFVKFEEKTYTEQSQYKREIESLIKSMNSTLNMLRLDMETIKQSVDKLSLVKEDRKEEIQEKVNKTETDLNSIKLKQHSLEKKWQDFAEKIDKVLSENLSFSGLVGDYNKFKDLKSVLEYLLSNANANQTGKDKSILELQILKDKIESKLASILNKYDLLEKSIKSQVYGRIEHVENIQRNSISNVEVKLDHFIGEVGNSLITLKELENTKLIGDLKSLKDSNCRVQLQVNEFHDRINKFESSLAKSEKGNIDEFVRSLEKRCEDLSASIKNLNEKHQARRSTMRRASTKEHDSGEETFNFRTFQASFLSTQIEENYKEFTAFKEDVSIQFARIFEAFNSIKQSKDFSFTQFSNEKSAMNNESKKSKLKSGNNRLNLSSNYKYTLNECIPRLQTIEGEPTIIYKMRQELAKDEMPDITKFSKKTINPIILNKTNSKGLNRQFANCALENKDISNYISFNLYSIKK